MMRSGSRTPFAWKLYMPLNQQSEYFSWEFLIRYWGCSSFSIPVCPSLYDQELHLLSLKTFAQSSQLGWCKCPPRFFMHQDSLCIMYISVSYGGHEYCAHLPTTLNDCPLSSSVKSMCSSENHLILCFGILKISPGYFKYSSLQLLFISVSVFFLLVCLYSRYS